MSEAYVTIQQHLNRFWRALDERDYDSLLTHVAPDGRWRRDKWYSGHDEIRTALSNRPANLNVRHITTGLIVDEIDGEYQAIFQVVGFGHTSSEGESLPWPVKGPAAIAENVARIAMVDGRPLIKSLEAHVMFRAAA